MKWIWDKTFFDVLFFKKNGCICDEIIQNNSCFTGKIC